MATEPAGASEPVRFASGVTYLVESAQDGTVLLALGPRLTEYGVLWHDTVRDRLFPVLELKREGDAVVVKTERAVYRFRPLTLALYNERVRHHVDGQPAFYTDEQVQQFYAAFPR